MRPSVRAYAPYGSMTRCCGFMVNVIQILLDFLFRYEIRDRDLGRRALTVSAKVEELPSVRRPLDHHRSAEYVEDYAGRHGEA